MGIVDLTLILIYYTVSLVREIRLMVSRLSQDHDLSVLGAVTPSLMHVFLVLSSALTDYDPSRISSVRKVYGITVLVDCDDRASTQVCIKACLALYF